MGIAQISMSNEPRHTFLNCGYGAQFDQRKLKMALTGNARLYDLRERLK
jgi:hypothetical protein